MNEGLPVRTRYRVGGMDCASCAGKIENAVTRLPGVNEVGVSVSAGTLSVLHQPALNLAAVERQVKALGFTIAAADAPAKQELAGDHHPPAEEAPWWRTTKAKLTIGCAVALGLAYLLGKAVPQVEHWAFLAALSVGLVPVARRAVTAALAGTPFSIETLMSIAAIGAVFIGATEEAATVVLLFLVGEMLEGVAAGRARQSIRGLADLVPKQALVERDGGFEEVAAEALPIGAAIMVRPGDRIAADGTIVDGESAVDEAPVTGESVPKRKSVGDTVFAGTINVDAVLRVRVTATAADNTIARVVKLVEEAQESKAPTERFIDRFSRYYTPFVLLIGVAVAVLPPASMGEPWLEWVYKGLAVLLIGCPCALVISTPAAIAAGLSAGARRGLLMKGGAVLEQFRRVTAVALDKTGTLTLGKPVVTDIVAAGRSEKQVLAMAAALEAGSSHPLALAILNRAKADKAPIPPAFNAKALAGRGVAGSVGGETAILASPQAAHQIAPLPEEMKDRIAAFNDEGKTVSVLLVGTDVAGLIAMRDEPRPDAAAALRSLREDGIATVMLTGDDRRTASAIAGRLGIEARAELLPEDKQTIVRELKAGGAVVAKVGDGINDAPALAAADIGIAMGGGTDVALETADAAALHGRVADIPDMVHLSRTVMGNIWQNITIALGLKGVFLVTTILGMTGLWPAILADTGATVLVTANAMRLLGWRGRQY
ncbi:heavy metal translocating P-type ATPase [Sinorhizobium americanum]|uniref:heavy metal translocating P-type ATPase n=1 Tax=Sinorhizobium americanum TaxID=194963 RepID=UPI0007DA21BD|nr:heavy metal translocating P-type ATPase [Sinorhizobium americanum]OAP41853.1 ATPase [Sinorhizobium americanum]